MPTSPESYFDSFHKTSQGEFKNSYYNPFHVKPRKRTSKEQLEVLEKTFETNIKPDAALRKALATKLRMTPRSVQVWFQNKRAKVKNTKAPAEKKEAEKEIELESLFIKKENKKEDYECFLSNYSGYTKEYGSVPQKHYLEESHHQFKEEDLETLDKLVLGEENVEKNKKKKKDEFCTFYSMANTLQFDPSNYLN
ncbi:hypothetical protein NEMIN01_1696 [Nematocida minor]|uniref:uncharacterized protein n=1 Tax=Nematocida minor TaxID=1912983 RepID=UPI0022202825|nr:uncharacterized protein NEMIN01_1696 [Nematocida minor]KAI5191841.1 hypothetical protein NEMIN01_1696 [Nematocida minor]